MNILLPFGTVVLNIASVALLVSLIWRLPLAKWVGRYALMLGFLLSLSAVLGSLYYSEIIGFEPCVLCWWQRIAIYPLLVLFTVALISKDRGVFRYVLPFSVITAILAVYQSYIQWGGNPLIPCGTAVSCTKLYVYEFGYITIPTMSLSIAFAMILLWWANKANESRHS